MGPARGGGSKSFVSKRRQRMRVERGIGVHDLL